MDTRRRLVAALVAGIILAALAVPAATAATPDPACTDRVLVLSAMPLELNPLFRAASIDPSQTKHVDDRTFYLGQLAGVDVVMAITGIGPANAGQASAAAFDDLGCTFKGAVFSGVAGSVENIGDVTVPTRWTSDPGDPTPSWTTANAGMLASAGKLPGNVSLSQDVPVGDAACLCPGVDAATPVHMPQPAKLVVRGDGETTDPFGGHAVPCVPGGGDIAGCEPCITIDGTVRNAPTFASKTPTLVTDPTFWEALFQTQTATTSAYEAQDEETAIVAQAAAARGVPFLGVRAVSDGQNDPLHLPGFPFQFFVYRQLAGNNAAAVTTAFLAQWKADRFPTRVHGKSTPR